MEDDGGGGPDGVEGSRLWRAVVAGDLMALRMALPAVRGVDGGARFSVFGAASPDRKRGAVPAGGPDEGSGDEGEGQGGGGAWSDESEGEGDEAPPGRLQGWRPLSLARTNAAGQTPLHLAARQGHGAMVSLLLERGAELNAQDAEGRTPFVEAAKHGAAAVAAILVAAALRSERAARGAGDDLEQLIGIEGRDALIAMLHAAADRGDVVAVRKGLQAAATLLAKAIELGDTQYIEKMLKAGLELELDGAAERARRHSQEPMAQFLESLAPQPAGAAAEAGGTTGAEGAEVVAQATSQPTDAVEAEADKDQAKTRERRPQEEEEKGGGEEQEQEPEPAPVSLAHRLAVGEVAVLERACAQTDLAQIDQVRTRPLCLAKSRSSTPAVCAPGPRDAPRKLHEPAGRRKRCWGRRPGSGGSRGSAWGMAAAAAAEEAAGNGTEGESPTTTSHPAASWYR